MPPDTEMVPKMVAFCEESKMDPPAPPPPPPELSPLPNGPPPAPLAAIIPPTVKVQALIRVDPFRWLLQPFDDAR